MIKTLANMNLPLEQSEVENFQKRSIFTGKKPLSVKRAQSLKTRVNCMRQGIKSSHISFKIICIATSPCFEERKKIATICFRCTSLLWRFLSHFYFKVFNEVWHFMFAKKRVKNEKIWKGKTRKFAARYFFDIALFDIASYIYTSLHINVLLFFLA